MSDQTPPKQENMDHIHVQQDGMFLRDRALTAMNQAAYRNRNPSLFSQKDSPRLSSLPKPVLVVNFKLRLFTQLCTLSFGCLSVTSYLFSNDILFGIGLLLLLPCLVGMGVIHFTNPRCTSNFEKFFIWSSFASNFDWNRFLCDSGPCTVGICRLQSSFLCDTLRCTKDDCFPS